eukprot:comp19203_c0_seq1/m.21931 comp19203_c0_seq1/g.21931  ORF comp19203_c0_seq1/g.21931 comp19203_c0_seq1/m.21931 type:complete len:336 (-) comp19203_c0_seq1:441-1448(-)
MVPKCLSALLLFAATAAAAPTETTAAFEAIAPQSAPALVTVTSIQTVTAGATPITTTGPRKCCKARMAECLACAAGVTPFQFCKDSPKLAPDCALYQKEIIPSAASTPAVAVFAGTAAAAATTAASEPMLQACCAAMSPTCLGCMMGLTGEEWCALPENKDNSMCEPVDNPKACCLAMTPSCLACAAGQSEKKWCNENKDTELGKMCDSQAPAEKSSCCKVFSPECLSCVEGVTEQEWCAASIDKPNGYLCQDQAIMPATTTAAATATPVETAATDIAAAASSLRPTDTAPADKMCCMAMTPACLACAQSISVERWCEQNRSNSLYVMCQNMGTQ